MNYDWNWFFSSFCQCAAALIGIIGAFVISRLLGLSEKVNSTIAEFDNLVIQYQKLKSSISKRRFYWYTEKSVRHGTHLINPIRDGDFDDLDQEQIIENILSCDPNLFKIRDAIMEGFNEIKEMYSPKEITSSYHFKDADNISMIANANKSTDIIP